MITHEKTITDYEKTGVKIARLTPEQIESIMSELGPYTKMTPYETQELSRKKMPGESLSEEIIKMRNEGW